jgi:hypothetical protein
MLGTSPIAAAGTTTVELSTPQPPPEWALLERELLRANADACREFFRKYFDERGFLLCVERWGGDDGPDDAIENLNDWPILHALGGADDVLAMVHKGWEGHLRQYTLAKTKDVPFARDGMYYQEFPVMFDWLHNGEGANVFSQLSLCDAGERAFQNRVRRFADFYAGKPETAEPGGADKFSNPNKLGNYDPKHRIIRSMFNGSRGPLLRPATALDWAGDPVEVEGRFRPGHGERNYEDMLAHFKDYNDIVGDHPLNLLSTSLALNAYALTGEERYRRWLLEYVDAWRQRMIENGNIIPTKIGLDGRIGGPSGQWYSGVYGWAFSVEVPQNKTLAHRNSHDRGFTGFSNAYLLTGDDRWLDPWRKQIDKINAAAKQEGGRTVYPRMYGPKGWYQFLPEKYSFNAAELCYLTLRPDDRARLPDYAPGAAWFDYLAGKRPNFPAEDLRADFEHIRQQIANLHTDTTTPDTRLADDPFPATPCSVTSLIHLMLGGIHPGKHAGPLHCAVRYFDPIRRRAGLPPDVAALVEGLTNESLTLRLVNISQTEERLLTVQGGAYGEHQLLGASDGKNTTPIDGRTFDVHLAPGGGGRLVIGWKRHTNQPTLGQPWTK